MEAKQLTDEELRSALRRLASSERVLIGDVLRHLIEADGRRLAGAWGFDSLFSYCISELRFSEPTAFKRINGARLAERLPVVLKYLDSGKVHLDGLVKLAAHLNRSNVIEVLERASGKTSKDIDLIVAELAPKPDRPDFLRRIPDCRPAASLSRVPSASLSESPAPSPSVPQAASVLPVPRQGSADDVPAAQAAFAPVQLQSPAARHDQLHARSPGRHYIGFTAGDRLRDKLLRAQALMRQSRPRVSYEDVVEAALDAWLDRKDPERAALRRESRRRQTRITGRPPRTPGGDRPSLPQALRDAVYLRDGGRCTHVSSTGRRCTARTGLEVDHRIPRAKGGTDDLANLRLLCREHNRMEAVREFGSALVGPERRGAFSASRPGPFIAGVSRPPDSS